MARKRRSSGRRRSRGGLGSLGVPLCPCSPAQMAGLRGLGAGEEYDPYSHTPGTYRSAEQWRTGVEDPRGESALIRRLPGVNAPREDRLKSDLIFVAVLAAAAGGGYFVYKKWFSKPTVKASVSYSTPYAVPGPTDYVTAPG